MVLGEGLAEVGDVELGVVLEDLKRFVSKQFLDVVDVGVGFDHLGGAAATEGVGRDLELEAGHGGVATDDDTDAALVPSPASAVEEHGPEPIALEEEWPGARM